MLWQMKLRTLMKVIYQKSVFVLVHKILHLNRMNSIQ